MRALFFLLTVLFAHGAAAKEPDAQTLFDQGLDAFDKGAIAESNTALEQAATLTKDPSLLARIHLQLGLNRATEGRTEEARVSFERALEYDPDLRLDPVRHKPDFVRLFDDMRTQAAGELRVEAAGSGQQIWIDGTRRGRGSCRVRLSPGTHRVEIREAAGVVVASRTVCLRPRGVETMTLGPRPAREQGPATVPTTATDPDPVSPRNRAGYTRRRIWTWITAGAAVAAAATAVGLGLSARSDREEACGLLHGENDCNDRRALGNPDDFERYESLYDSVTAKSLGMKVTASVAAGLAVTSVLLYLLEGRGAEGERSETRLSATPLAGPGWGLSLSLSR